LKSISMIFGGLFYWLWDSIDVFRLSSMMSSNQAIT